MANDFSNWLDNAPVIGSDLNVNFDFWLDAAPFLDLEAPTDNRGVLDVTLDNATILAVTRVQVGATLNVTLGAATLSSQAIAPALASLDVLLADATLSSTVNPVAGASLTVTLDSATLTSATVVVVAGSLDVLLADATLTSDVDVGATANLSVTLDNATISSTGIVADAIHGTLSITLDAAVLSATIGLGEEPFYFITDADLALATRSGYFYFDYQMFDFDRETTAAIVSTNQELERLIAMVEGHPRLKGWLLVPTSDFSSTSPRRASLYDLKKIRAIFNPVDTNPVFPQTTD